jgi:hypothetical protein
LVYSTLRQVLSWLNVLLLMLRLKL